jgi:type IV secretion system protein VirD4
MAQIVRRILGIGFDGKPIYAPKHAHSLLLAAAGSGKTTCGAVPWLQSLIADMTRAIVISDFKEAEIASQCAVMCAKYGRKVAIIDEFGILDLSHPSRLSLNPLSALISAYEKQNGELIFAIETACHAIIPEPLDDAKNQYFRDEPRTLIEFCMAALLKRSLCTPGAVWSMLAHVEMMLQAAKIEADEGDEYLCALAGHVLGMTQHEHFQMHRSAALKAMRIYAASSALHHSGLNADLTPEDLIQEKYIVFITGPIRYMERLGSHLALIIQSFMEVILTGNSAPVTFIIDEFTNTKMKALVAQLTTMRGYGANCLIIAQSRSEIERKYGKLETRTILENCVIRQYFGFSSYEEAEQVSRAMGETLSIATSLGTSSDKLEFTGNYSTQKERLYPPEKLMTLPADEQIIYGKDFGYVHCKKVAQNQASPYCYDLEENKIEGGTLPPDPIIELPIPENGSMS